MDECLSKPLDRGVFTQVMARLRPEGQAPVGSPDEGPAAEAADAPPAVEATPATAAPIALSDDPDAPIDVGAILKRALNDPEFVVQLLERFRGRCEERLAQLARAVEMGSANAVAEEAHGLLGAARHLSAKGLEAACHTMELAARAGDVRTAALCVPDVRREMRRCAEYVPRAVANLRACRAASA